MTTLSVMIFSRFLSKLDIIHNLFINIMTLLASVFTFQRY